MITTLCYSFCILLMSSILLVELCPPSSSPKSEVPSRPHNSPTGSPTKRVHKPVRVVIQRKEMMLVPDKGIVTLSVKFKWAKKLTKMNMSRGINFIFASLRDFFVSKLTLQGRLHESWIYPTWKDSGCIFKLIMFNIQTLKYCPLFGITLIKPKYS